MGIMSWLSEQEQKQRCKERERHAAYQQREREVRALEQIAENGKKEKSDA